MNQNEKFTNYKKCQHFFAQNEFFPPGIQQTFHLAGSPMKIVWVQFDQQSQNFLKQTQPFSSIGKTK